jgi:hypothetical protein
MRIFGRRWLDPANDLRHDYVRGRGSKPLRFIHLPRRGGPMVFPCDICREKYHHWLCSDRMWAKLPAEFRGLYLCLSCYRCVRFVTGSGRGAGARASRSRSVPGLPPA